MCNSNFLKTPVLVLIAVIMTACGASSSSGGANGFIATADTRSPSVSRQWNEVLLDAIRNDFARPTVHARNLFHISAAMYDAWAVYDATSRSYLLGQQVGAYNCGLTAFTAPQDIHPAREEAISYAVYRLILHRFANSPGAQDIADAADAQMLALGLDTADVSMSYADGSPAAMGNYIADCYIQFGLQDGANEVNDYINTAYLPVNPAVEPELPGNPNIVDLDRWQPISLTLFIDQAGNPIANEPEFLSPEWGQVQPFALSDADKTTYQRNGFDYEVYFDPGMPPTHAGTLFAEYKWGFSLVSIWSSHLDQNDGVLMDISPASLGNIQQYPASVGEYPQFYDLLNGGDASVGYTTNPVTGAAYTPQIVPRGDYARVLAEFWADGPESETPPFAGYLSGHSTYSRAGAEILTSLTGSEYFPGGMSGFEIIANDFLVFEEGPSVDMTLQWATYRDASDQCSLSRIWGGIHPPADDIPGRLIGEQIGNNAFDAAVTYFNGAP